METLKKIAKLLFGSVTAKILQFIFFFWVAKLLTKNQFGQYAVSMTLFLILLYPLLEFGSELLINREASKGNRGYFFQIVYWKLIAFPFVAVLGLLIGRLVFNLNISILLFSAFFVLLKSLENGNAACLRGINRTEIESFHLIFSRTLSILLLAVVSIIANKTLTIEFVISIQIISIFISIIAIEKKYLLDIPLPQLNIKELKKILIVGFPLALNSVAWLVYFKIDVLLISRMINSAEAGTYEIAYKMLEATFVLPGVIMAIVFRHLVCQQTKKGGKEIFFYTAISLSITGIVIAISSVLILPYFFPLLFNHHIKALNVYEVLAVAIPIIYLAHLTTQTLVVQKQNYTYLGITLIGAIINFSLNIYFIDNYGMIGAAIATVITEAFVLLFSGYFVYKHFRE